MYSEPEKITVNNKRRKVIAPASYKDVDTGTRQEVVIIDKNGGRTVEERPVTKRIFVNAVIEEVEVPEEFHAVTNQNTGERHDFKTLAEARRFIRESR